MKVSTLYAYVSRGLLVSHPDPARRGSLFDLDQVEALAARSRGGRQTATRMATITTGVTQLNQELGPIYRGRLATELAGEWRFEDVAELLWQSRGRRSTGGHPISVPVRSRPRFDRMRWALVVCGATDPLRSDRRPPAVASAARRATAALAEVVGPPPTAGDGDRSIAARLGGAPDGHDHGPARAAVNAALVLWPTTSWPRRPWPCASPPRCAPIPTTPSWPGWSPWPGPLHGGASQQAYELLAMAERDGAARALDDVLRDRGIVPGFGHTVYKSGDPRFESLLALAEPLLSEERRALLREVMEIAAANDVPLANCDLALAALSWGTGMPPDTGRTLFAVARISGWAAHYMEELTERALRFRARAVYSST